MNLKLRPGGCELCDYNYTNSKEYFDNLLDSSSDSSEKSMDEDIPRRSNKMIDNAIKTSLNEQDIKKVNKWARENTTKHKPTWYHMPDVNMPKLTQITK